MNGFAGLASISLIPISFFFFFGKIRGFLFSVYWAFFFLVGLPVTLLLLLLFSDFSSKFFLDFFFNLFFI